MIGEGIGIFIRASEVANMEGLGVFIAVKNDFTKLKK